MLAAPTPRSPYRREAPPHAFIAPGERHPSMQTTPSWPATPRVHLQPISVDVYLRSWAKTHLPARARMGGSAHQSLFTFDPCDSSTPKLSLTIRLANSVLLKASFCGVLGLEWPGSWRRGDQEQSASGVCRWPRFGPQEHPAVPCPQNFHVKQRTVRRPHLTGRTKRCTGSLSTIRPVDRPELIFAVESQTFPSACRFDAG
jgi:hypothetical protein